jgi:hypothetical protein
MYICIYVYIYTHVYICVYMYIYIYMYITQMIPIEDSNHDASSVGIDNTSSLGIDNTCEVPIGVFILLLQFWVHCVHH